MIINNLGDNDIDFILSYRRDDYRRLFNSSFNIDSISNYYSCNESCSGTFTPSTKSLAIIPMYNFKNEDFNSFLTVFKNSFKEFCQFTNSKVCPEIDIVCYKDNDNILIPYGFIVNFSNCMDMVNYANKRLMLLKYIRQIFNTFGERLTVEEKIKNIVDYEKDDIIILEDYEEEEVEQLIIKAYKLFNYLPEASEFLSLSSSMFKRMIVRGEENLPKENNYKLIVWSKHPSHAPLRGLPVYKPTIIRFGYSLRKRSESQYKDFIILNKEESIKKSASKIRMRKAFIENNIRCAEGICPKNKEELEQFLSQFSNDKFIIKSEFGSRGEGLYLIENKDEAIKWFETKFTKLKKEKYGNYIIEKYYPYVKEYRLHVSKHGCFYSCRKMLKSNAEIRWYRNDDNCVWILEENDDFQKPTNWKEIEAECVKALHAVGLDIGACDVRVQSGRDKNGNLRKKINFIICEINSAPGLHTIGLQQYQTEIRKLCAD